MSTSPTLEDNEKTTEQADNYLKRFRLYDTKAKTWIPYDPSTFVPKVAYKREDTTNYFYLDVRYEKPGSTMSDLYQLLITDLSYRGGTARIE